MLSERQNFGLAMGVVAVCLFAATLPATHIGLVDTSPWFLTATRATIAGIAGVVMLIVTRRRCPPRHLLLPILACSFVVVLGFPLAAAIAMMTVPSSHGGVIMGILPLATAAAAALIQHERPSRGFWIAAMVGSALVMTFAIYRGGGHSLSLGDALLLFAVVCGGIGYTLSGRLSGFMPGWEVISWVVAFALPVAIVSMLLSWPDDVGAISLRSWTAILYVGLIAQYSAFFLWNAALAMGGIARVGQISLLQPFVVVVLAATFAGEELDWQTLVFATAVVITVAIGTRMRVAAPPA